MAQSNVNMSKLKRSFQMLAAKIPLPHHSGPARVIQEGASRRIWIHPVQEVNP